MRILIHSNSPWAPTGYGQQTAIWSRIFRDHGHEVFISSFWGLQSAPMSWEGITVLPCGNDTYGNDTILAHYRSTGADLIITLMDIWVLNPANLRGLPVAHWLALDCSPLSVMDQGCLTTSGAYCLAMSRFGQRSLSDRGFGSLYIPHGIDTGLFRPHPERERLRESLGLSDSFVIGLNANNKDPFRKGTVEQMRAFARLAQKHSDAVLLLHTGMDPSAGSALDLFALARHLGIEKSVRHVSQYEYFTGMITSAQVAEWYSTLDLFSNTSFGEGFGLPIVEAEACGVPTVVTDASSMSEVSSGWKVGSEPFWNPTHKAEWAQPHVQEILGAYEEAYSGGTVYKEKKETARAHALQYDIETVWTRHWEPALELLADWCIGSQAESKKALPSA